MIETKIEGKPAQVTSAATWMRGLARNVDEAAELAAQAQSAARGWHGEAGASYAALVKQLVSALESHGERVRTAAKSVESYADQLSAAKRDLRDLRTRATKGGLTLSGTTIMPPAPAAYGPFVPGSAEETAQQEAVDKIELYNTLVGEATTIWTTFSGWIAAHLARAVGPACEADDVDGLLKEIEAVLPGFLSGAALGFYSLMFDKISKDFKASAAELRRKVRRSGNPATRNYLKTPQGKFELDQLLDTAGKASKFARFLSGPFGVGLEVALAIKEGMETGDWKRVALTTGASIGTAALLAAAVAAGVVTAPAWAVVVAGGAITAGVAWTVGKVYDNWDSITGWAGDRAGDVKKAVSGAWGGTKDLAGGAWDLVSVW